MNEIPHLPRIELSKAEIIWLTEVWNTLLETGNNPRYRGVRNKTTEETGDSFDPCLIDKRLVKENATHITLLGVLHIVSDFKFLDDAERIILQIKKKLRNDVDLTDVFIGDVAEELNFDKKYAQILFSLVAEYGGFWNSAGSNSHEGGPYGYERFTINAPSTLETYIQFKTLPKFLEDYYQNRAEYDKKEQEIRLQASKIIASTQLGNANNGHVNSELFELSLFEETRGYIKRIASQASLCYRYGLYDACFVMVRKLIETLIIEAFERHGISKKITGNDGHFLFLGDLISIFLKETLWSTGRNTKSGLPKNTC